MTGAEDREKQRTPGTGVDFWILTRVERNRTEGPQQSHARSTSDKLNSVIEGKAQRRLLV